MTIINKNKGYTKGLIPADHSRLHLKFGDFLTSMPTAPLVDAAPQLNYPMDGNDRVGCCVVAGWDHYRQVVTQLLTGTGLNFTQDQIWKFYQTQNPQFDPNGTADTNGPGSQYDCGMSVQLFLEYLQKNGYIIGFAKIDHRNTAELQAAIWIGLSVITGVILDNVQMDQFPSGTWTNVPGASVDGGHCVPAVGYQNGIIDVVTWAKLVNCTQSFIQNQMDECWFVLTQYHVDHPNFRNHFDLAGFSAAVSAITGGQVTIPVHSTPTPLFSQTLKVGMSGPDVVKLQAILGIKADGKFGPATLAAVEAFQARHGLTPDGIVGPKTMAALAAVIAPIPAPNSLPPISTNVIIKRQPSDSQETQGHLIAGYFMCCTLERPWLDNQPMVSCIPAGTYTLKWAFQADLNEWHYEVQDVPGRTGIFLHEMNYVNQVEGCIGIGQAFADINGDGEPDVTNSRATVAAFEALFPGHPDLTLTITN